MKMSHLHFLFPTSASNSICTSTLCRLIATFIILSSTFCFSGWAESRVSRTAAVPLASYFKAYERTSLKPVSHLYPDASRKTLPIVLLELKAFGKTFLISLRRPDQSIFTDDAVVVIYHGNGTKVKELAAVDLDTGAVVGHLLGALNSSVRGILSDGMFEGIISTDSENYYVEPASKFIPVGDPRDVIVYRESDVLFNSRKFDVQPHSPRFCKGDVQSPQRHPRLSRIDRNSVPEVDFAEQPASSRRLCKVKIVSDHVFFNDLSRGNLQKTIANMEFHIREADKIFRATDFDSDGRPDEIRMRVARAEVFRDPDDRGYMLGDPRLNATDFLRLFSYYNHDGFCAAVAFSHKRFPDDVLGYAYRGGPRKAGGLCYRRQMIKGEVRSMNVAMVSLNAPWGTLAVAQSTVVVTHELGHMAGAPHDEDADGGICFHPQLERHYLMSSMANPGTTTTNRQFSKCSKNYIFRNLKVNGGCLVCRGPRDCGDEGHRVNAQCALIWTALLTIQIYRLTF